jgi:serine protease 16
MTCNVDSSCPFGRGYHDVARNLELCQVLFGIDPDTVSQNVNSTLSYYGGRDLVPNTGEDMIVQNDGQKRIIFTNGDADPWTALTLTLGNDDHPSFIVKGASHHFWTHAVKDKDGVFVNDARKTIYDTVSSWLAASVPSFNLESELLKTNE